MSKTQVYFILTSFFALHFHFLARSQPYGSPSVSTGNTNQFIKNGDPFGGRVFVENKGQFADINGRKVLYALDNGFEQIYFTAAGLVHKFTKVASLNERQRERLERGNFDVSKLTSHYFVNMNWLGANPDIKLGSSEKQSYYITYGEKELNSSTFKKLIYKNVYNNIDIEYTIPEDKTHGVKYAMILHPGANAGDIKIAYSGDVNGIKIKNNEVVIKTPYEDIVEHSPLSFYENGDPVTSGFNLVDDIISYSIPTDYEKDKTLVIDPWVTSTTTLIANSYAYDVDYDFLGYTYVYGGSNPFKVACYNPAGILQWVFGGIVISQNWTSAPIANYASNFGVDRFTGKTYIGQGFSNTGNLIVRLDAAGNYDNFINAANPQFQEVWDMGFHCTTAQVFVLGGGVSTNISAVTINSISAALALSTFQPLNPGVAQDVVSHAIDDAANIFVVYAGNAGVSNKICLVSQGFNNNIWTQATGYTSFTELGNKSQYVSSGASSNGFNALAVNNNYLYYYDGYHLAAYNKTSGVLISSTTVIGNTLKQQGGIAVDDCNNIYIGGNGAILTYSYSGTSFTQMSSIPLGVSTTNQYVYDLKLNKQSKLLYACGSGFVGIYSPVNTLACTTLSSSCLFSQGGISVSTTSISCASLGSATCSAIGGVGPFTYTWLPSAQSGSVATGLNPGLHSIAVHDVGNNSTYTATAYLSPLVAFTGSLANTIYLDCYGSTSATAAITNLSGGSGSQSYTWTNGVASQTTAIASGLSVGQYTVNVVDALTACAITQTFSVSQPPQLTLSILANSPSVCANSSVTLIPLIGGGTPGYTYSWTTGPPTGTYITTQSIPGNHVYTLTAFDSKSCTVVSTVSINYISTPTLTLNNATICLGNTATLNVSGANSYTWSDSSTGTSFVSSPTVTTNYSVVGSGSLCNASANAWIIVSTLPSPTLTTNSPVCSGQPVNLNASGGSAYSWSGPNGFTSPLANPVIASGQLNNTGNYTVLVSNANTCTTVATASVIILPLPPVSAAGSTVCETQTITLNANSAPANNFFWTGPNSFTSSAQNPVINNLSVIHSGTYQVIVTDANNCTNSAVADVTVTAMPVPVFITNSPLCYNKTLSFNAGATTGGISYHWSGPNGFVSNLQNPQITNVTLPATGMYSLTVTAGPCVTGTVDQVVIYPLPTLTIVGNTSLCEMQKISLNIVASGNVQGYNWSGPAGFNAFGPSFVRDSSLFQFSGIYTAEVTDSHQCKNSATLSVNVYTNPVISTKDVTVCINDPAILSANGAFSYMWYGPGFYQTSGANALVPVANSISPLTYTVIGSTIKSCTNSATSVLNTRPLPEPLLSIIPGPTLCVNDEATFAGYGGERYEWRVPGGIFYEGQKLTFKASGFFTNGEYTLTAVDGYGCRASIDTLLVIHNLPTGTLERNDNGSCIPFCTNFYFKSTNNSAIKASWQIKDRVFSSPTFSYCFKEDGLFTINGNLYDETTTCSNTVSVNVTAYPKPKADFTVLPDVVIENLEASFINTSEGDELTNFNWFFVNNAGYTSSSRNTFYKFETEGQFPVAMVVKNKWGCTDSVLKIVNVDPDFLIYVPDAFTPNEDNLNEVFMPVCRAVKLYHFYIFDRWGALIFETVDSSVGWDGTYRGESCKSDVYTWKIIVSSIQGEMKELKGHVTLYR